MAEAPSRVPIQVRETEWLRACMAWRVRISWRYGGAARGRHGARAPLPPSPAAQRRTMRARHSRSAPMSICFIVAESEATTFTAELDAHSQACRTRWWTSVTARFRSNYAVRTPSGCSPQCARCCSMSRCSRSTHVRAPCSRRPRSWCGARGWTLFESRSRGPTVVTWSICSGRSRANCPHHRACGRSFLRCRRIAAPGVPTVEVTHESREITSRLAPPGRRVAVCDRAFHRRRACRRAGRAAHRRESRERRATLRGFVRHRGGYRHRRGIGPSRVCSRRLALHGAARPTRGAEPPRRADRAEHGSLRAARYARHGQADPRHARRRRPAVGADLPLFRRALGQGRRGGHGHGRGGVPTRCASRSGSSAASCRGTSRS